MAKVEQLMALVDQLERQLAVSRTAATALLDAVVGELATQGKQVATEVATPVAHQCRSSSSCPRASYGFGQTGPARETGMGRGLGGFVGWDETGS